VERNSFSKSAGCEISWRAKITPWIFDLCEIRSRGDGRFAVDAAADVQDLCARNYQLADCGVCSIDPDQNVSGSRGAIRKMGADSPILQLLIPLKDLAELHVVSHASEQDFAQR
jgi:hypothetical protein